MFDPHRTRRSDSRYFTRKGQVLQASRVNTNPVIDQRLVPIYKNYIIKNNILTAPPPAPTPTIKVTGVKFTDGEYHPLSSFTYSEEPQVTINPGQISNSVVCALYKDTNGVFHFYSAAYPGSGQAGSKTISNNSMCYYAVIPASTTVLNNWATNDKILMASENDEIINFYYKYLDISSAVPLSF